jgi:hypothetical protein
MCLSNIDRENAEMLKESLEKEKEKLEKEKTKLTEPREEQPHETQQDMGSEAGTGQHCEQHRDEIQQPQQTSQQSLPRPYGPPRPPPKEQQWRLEEPVEQPRTMEAQSNPMQLPKLSQVLGSYLHPQPQEQQISLQLQLQPQSRMHSLLQGPGMDAYLERLQAQFTQNLIQARAQQQPPIKPCGHPQQPPNESPSAIIPVPLPQITGGPSISKHTSFSPTSGPSELRLSRSQPHLPSLGSFEHGIASMEVDLGLGGYSNDQIQVLAKDLHATKNKFEAAGGFAVSPILPSGSRTASGLPLFPFSGSDSVSPVSSFSNDNLFSKAGFGMGLGQSTEVTSTSTSTSGPGRDILPGIKLKARPLTRSISSDVESLPVKRARIAYNQDRPSAHPSVAAPACIPKQGLQPYGSHHRCGELYPLTTHDTATLSRQWHMLRIASAPTGMSTKPVSASIMTYENQTET